MTDLAEAQVAEQPSTVINPDTPADASGGGVPRVIPEDKPEKVSLRDTIAKVVKEEEPKADGDDKGPDAPEGKAKAEEGDEKPADAKEGRERAPDGKFKAKEGEAEPVEVSAEADGEAKSADDNKPHGRFMPPPKFLPDAKEVWRNVPRTVQRDVANMAREHEAEITQYREAAERFEPIRHFDEVARRHGRAGVHETLQEIAQLEDMMAANPLAALNQVLLRAGPRKADGQPVSLYELAQFVVQQGQDGYQKMVAQQPQQQQQQQPNPEIAQLKAELARIQEQQLAATVIDPFRAAHPRYEELQGDIAFFLQSSKIPTSLSPPERLAAAYDMAVRINPPSHANDADLGADPDPGRADDDLSGSKSIKSAPGAISPEMEPERGGSIRDLLASEMKRAKRS